MFKKIGIFLVSLVSYTNAQSFYPTFEGAVSETEDAQSVSYTDAPSCENVTVGYVTFWPGKLNMWTNSVGVWQHEALGGPGSTTPLGTCINDNDDSGLVQYYDNANNKNDGNIDDYCNSKYPNSEQGEGKMVTNTFYVDDSTSGFSSNKCVYECVKCVETPVDCCKSNQWNDDDCFGSAAPTNQVCCKAMTATCLACAAGVTPHEYCQKCFVQGCKINEFVSASDPASLSEAYRSLGQCGDES